MTLALGTAFGEQVDALAGLARSAALGEWSRLDTGNLQPSFVVFVARTAPLLETFHGLAVETARGYVRAEGESAGADVSTVRIEDEDPFGRDVGQLLGPVVGKVYLTLAQGRPMAEAIEIGSHAVASIAESFVRDAARTELSAAFERSDGIVGLRWWSRGTCGACLAFDDGRTLSAGTSLKVHPSCRCIVEPVFDDVAPVDRPTGPERLREFSTEEREESGIPLDLILALLAGRVSWRSLRRRDGLGRVEEPDAEDVLP